MSRMKARPAASTLVLALAHMSSLCLAGTPATTPIAAPSGRLTLESFNKLMKAEKALTAASIDRDANLERALAMHGDPDTVRRWTT